jgi:hypothetical protein
MAVADERVGLVLPLANWARSLQGCDNHDWPSPRRGRTSVTPTRSRMADWCRGSATAAPERTWPCGGGRSSNPRGPELGVEPVADDGLLSRMHDKP